jgi:hypothetical protein
MKESINYWAGVASNAAANAGKLHAFLEDMKICKKISAKQEEL